MHPSNCIFFFLSCFIEQALYSYISKILFCGNMFITNSSAITIYWNIVDKFILSAKCWFTPCANISLRCICFEHILDSKVSKEQNRLLGGCKENPVLKLIYWVWIGIFQCNQWKYAERSFLCMLRGNEILQPPKLSWNGLTILFTSPHIIQWLI